jgi:hypothetical protein
VYHVELRQFPHVARVFNLEHGELHDRFVRPWVNGQPVQAQDRRWSPDRARLKILDGPPLRSDQLGMGRGWAMASRGSQDVTEAVLSEARRSERREIDALRSAVSEVARAPIGFQDVIALAAAANPHTRASDQLRLAEQAVWEMLHQGRLEMTDGERPIPPQAWEPIVLSWATWTGAEGASLRLQAVTRD